VVEEALSPTTTPTEGAVRGDGGILAFRNSEIVFDGDADDDERPPGVAT
jgi:hypothetical protein